MYVATDSSTAPGSRTRTAAVGSELGHRVHMALASAPVRTVCQVLVEPAGLCSRFFVCLALHRSNFVSSYGASHCSKLAMHADTAGGYCSYFLYVI